MITAGIDSGSLTTKGVILDGGQKIIASDIRLTGGGSKETGQNVWREILEQAEVSEKDVTYVMSTGYGRSNFEFADKNITEISCHAAGIHFLFPEVETILDIGGQDCKAIRVDRLGQAEDFVMNEIGRPGRNITALGYRGSDKQYVYCVCRNRGYFPCGGQHECSGYCQGGASDSCRPGRHIAQEGRNHRACGHERGGGP